MSLQLYNTLTRTKEDFKTIEPNKVRMYVCGPTVYDKAHVGHAMSALVFDIIRRYLAFRGYDVTHAMNFTDVDDKIIRRANELNIDPYALAESYIDEFVEHLADLNILMPTLTPRATQEIDTIISMIEGLIEKGYAYPIDNGDVYFRVQKDDDYGRLSGRKLDDMQAGARIGVDERKEHPMDFALWKSARPGEPEWKSPWGGGRPGWHIECSAMNLKHLGDQIDIHGGGNDLVFPHHENEIAQTESLTGKQFANYWVHNGMLQLSGEKMSKSTGNLISVEAFLEDHSANTLRLMVLNSGYRHPLTFNDETIAQTEKALDRLHSALRPALPGAKGLSDDGRAVLQTQIETTRTKFVESMDDDFNTGGALGFLFELVRAANSARAAGAVDADLLPAQEALQELGSILGMRLIEENGGGSDADAFVSLLVEVRTELRKAKQFALSDLNVVIEDSKDGTTWRWG